MITSLDAIKTKRFIGLGLLGLTWSLLLWINFAIAPHFFAHFIAIPSLFVASGILALLLFMPNIPEKERRIPSKQKT